MNKDINQEYFSSHFSEPTPKNRKLIEKALSIDKKMVVGVINPTTSDVLLGPIIAAEKKLAVPVLIGDADKIRKTAIEIGRDISKLELIDIKGEIESVKVAVKLAKEGKFNALMRGHISTASLMKIALDKVDGIRTSRRVSHCTVMDIPAYEKHLICTDAAINIAPDLMTKKSMIENAVEFANKLGITNPQVALLSFVETVTYDVPAISDAAILCQMAKRGQIKNCVIDGPLSIDLAVSNEARLEKDFMPVLNGDPDIFVFPDINAANIGIKIMDYLAFGQSCGLAIGLQVPLILMRRSSPAIEHVLSFALAKIYCSN